MGRKDNSNPQNLAVGDEISQVGQELAVFAASVDDLINEIEPQAEKWGGLPGLNRRPNGRDLT
jgi:hypothetical protein